MFTRKHLCWGPSVAGALVIAYDNWSIYVHSRHRRCSRKKVFLEKFTGKHLRWGFFINWVTGLTPAILLKRDSKTGVFLWLLRNFSEHLQKATSDVNHLALVIVVYEFSTKIRWKDTFQTFSTSINSALKLLFYFFHYDISNIVPRGFSNYF